MEPHQLGIFLCVPPHELDKFEKDHPNDVNRQMTEVIKYWDNNADDCSWEALANAVQKMGKYGNLVKSLREQHSKPVGGVETGVTNKTAEKTMEKTAAKTRYVSQHEPSVVLAAPYSICVLCIP